MAQVLSTLFAFLVAAAFVVAPPSVFAQGAKKKTPEKKPAAASKEEPAAEETQAASAATEDEESETLPRIGELEVPEFQRLMQGPAVDWIVMHSQKVIFVEPLFPRPGTLDDVNQKIAKVSRKPGDPPETEDARVRRLALYYLPLTLLEGEEREFRLHTRFIREIIYYEDLMLRRIDLLLDERQVRKAYELLVALRERAPDWPLIEQRQQRLLSTEAEVQLTAGQPQHAAALLEALYEQNAKYPGLEEQFGGVFDRLLKDAVAARDPRQARFQLKRLARRWPNHKLIPTWTNRLTNETRDLLGRSAAAERDGQIEAALDLIEQAARTWPELPEILGPFNRLSNRRQRLRVGVLDLPPERTGKSIIPSAAERRRRELTETPLFAATRVDDKVARYDTRFCTEWDPAELGHQVILKLRSYRLPGESQPPLTAASLTAALAERLDPRHENFDARFAATVEGLTTRGPFELAVSFQQVPLRPEALFAFPYRRSRGPSLSQDGVLEEAAMIAADQFPFRVEPSTKPNTARYTRSVVEPDGLADRHIAEILETRYESHDKAIQGLLRGEVSFLPQVPASAVALLGNRSEFFIQPYAFPATHFLQFHPRSRALASRALRRGLIYGLDRQRLMTDLFVPESAAALGRLTTAPWPTSSYAYNRFVEQHPFDPVLAFSLAKTAEKELGDKPAPLKVWAPSQPDIQAAAKAIVKAWGAMSVEAQLLPATPGASGPGADDDSWDVVYRVERIAEPLVELWPLLALTRSTETAALGHLPTWLRHDLLELDRVGDWRSAETLLHKLHRQFAAEVHLIPLWEIDEHLVHRKTIRNVPDRPLQVYQSIERWKVEPWYSKE